MTFVKKYFPGLLLCLVVTLAATALQVAEVRVIGQTYLEALVLAILLGLAVRTAWAPGTAYKPGITLAAKFLLEVAVMLLGTAVSARTVMALGPKLLLGIVAVVALSIVASYLICRFLRLSPRMALLVACGNSICGNSAIAAVAPVIGAAADDIAASIAFTAVLGVIVVLLLPLLAPALLLSLTQYGVLAGLPAAGTRGFALAATASRAAGPGASNANIRPTPMQLTTQQLDHHSGACQLPTSIGHFCPGARCRRG